MLKIIDLIKEKLGFHADPSTAASASAIELVVDNSSPKIRLIRGYKKQLRQPVESALNHIAQLMEKIPEPLDLTGEAKTINQLTQVFFLNQDELRMAASNDPELTKFLADNDALVFFVLLTMDRHVKTRYGSRLQGEMVVRDVALKSVGFSEHKFRVPSLTMADVHSAVSSGLLQLLAHQALENIIEEQSRKAELDELKDELTAKMDIMASERRQMVLEWQDGASMQLYRESQELLDTIEDQLRVLQTKELGLDFYLHHVRDVLNHPDQYLSAERINLKLDRTGMLIEGDAGKGEDQIRVVDFNLNLNQRRSAALLKCDRNVLMGL